MMKKSQILATIALAMALGVVAPVSSASAKVVGQDVNNPDATKACEDLEVVIAEAKKAGGEYENKDGDKTAYYTLYTNLISDVEDMKDDAKTATNSARDTLVNAIRTAVSAAQTAADAKTDSDYDITSAAERNALKNITAAGLSENDSYDKAVSVAKDLIQKYSNIANAKDSDGKNLDSSAAAATAVASLNSALSVAQTTINGGYTTSDLNDLSNDLKAMGIDTYEIMNASGDTTETKGKALIAKAEGQSLYGTWYSLIENVNKAENKVCDVDSGVNFSVKEANDIRDAIVALTASINKGEPAQPINTPNGTTSDEDSVNAPATGIAGTAEGTATTVSIVAGLATALTALGAGVVAYRSARRK